MKVEFTNNNDEITMQIIAAWSDIEADYKELWKHYSHIPVKGFRAGAVPAKVIATMFKTEIENDMANRCSARLCRNALREVQLENGSPIAVSDVALEPGETFSFTASFLRMPEFDLPDYANLSLTADNKEDKLTEISEKLINLTTINLHDRFIENELAFSDTAEEAENARKAAADRVKLLLILKKIGRTEAIEVDDKDIDARIRQIAKENNTTPNAIKDYLLLGGGLSRLADFLLAEQVLSYIAEINV